MLETKGMTGSLTGTTAAQMTANKTLIVPDDYRA